ncbi:phage tail protein [Roseateles sp. PN1]|uniref:phage tail protein n=1 Tax=Roseateles sp. PN1 TaxID=3137372 RepID=UPI003139F6FF
MKDANGSHFELLLGQADWGRCTHVDADDGVERALAVGWATPAGRDRLPLAFEAGGIGLAKRIKHFRAAASDTAPDPARRLGAAMDRYGSVYWIADGGARIEVLSGGSRSVSVFATATPAAEDRPRVRGGFAPLAPAVPLERRLRGLAITGEQYLVAGLLPAPGRPGGLQVFDLVAGGPALELAWPAAWHFSPLDLAPRPCGGLAVLDREQGRVWLLDRRLGMQAQFPVDQVEAPSAFAPDVPAPAATQPWFALTVDALGGGDPVAIEVLADDSVLVMDAVGSDGFALITLYVDGLMAARCSTAVVRDLIPEADRAGFTLRGFDCAMAPREKGERLLIAAADGNQCFAFDLWVGQSPSLLLDPVELFLPMRRFGGTGLVRRAATFADITVSQDSGLMYASAVGTQDAWLPLVAQSRPRYAPEAAFNTPALDGDVPDCPWHRLIIDASIPPGCTLSIESRAADSLAALPDQRWRREPAPTLRAEGPELPWLLDAAPRTDVAAGKGSWELLFQQARGRFLQLRLTLAGEELATPRLMALRAWNPRFSYLREYLPALYREDEASADFIERFLANFEGMFTALEDRIVSATALFDVRSAPDATLDWLASWLGLVLDPAVTPARKRLLIRFAVPLFAYRGTTQGLRLATELVLSQCVRPEDFALPARSQDQPYGIRIIERFLTRRLPVPLLGETVIDAGPRWVEPAARWSPSEGAEGLQRRYAAARLAAGLDTSPPPSAPISPPVSPSISPQFRPIPPADADGARHWAAFCASELGGVPRLAAQLGSAWQAWTARPEVPAALGPDLPASWPAEAAQQTAWRDFLAAGLSPELKRALARWQRFIARRYQRSDAPPMVAAWGAWPAFDVLPPPDRLPASSAALADWLLFETRLEPMNANAHRFSVLLPSNGPLADAAALAQQIDFARRVVTLAKPAHTAFDVKPYWAMFRIGQARVGLDTLLGIGSRDPALAPHWVIGTGQIGASRVASPPQPPHGRLLLAC